MTDETSGSSSDNEEAGNPTVFKALLPALRPHLNLAMRKG